MLSCAGFLVRRLAKPAQAHVDLEMLLDYSVIGFEGGLVDLVDACPWPLR